jgi:hypothetical protein
MQKHVLKSKTFYFGLVTALAPLFPGAGEFIQSYASEISMVWGAAAIILRMVTKDKVVLKD